MRNNQAVKQGDVLFHIDPVRFQLALREAEAVLASKDASLQEAVREMNRVLALTNLEVSTQVQQQRSATAAEARAAYQQALADRDVARLNLERATIRASVNGIVSNFSMRPGDYATAGNAVFALVDTDSIYIAGYFQETKLPDIQIGDRVLVHLMGEDRTIEGHVESIAGGIADRELSDNSSRLANVNPAFSWVRLAQRVPVRVALDKVPEGIRLIAADRDGSGHPRPYPMKSAQRCGKDRSCDCSGPSPQSWHDPLPYKRSTGSETKDISHGYLGRAARGGRQAVAAGRASDV